MVHVAALSERAPMSPFRLATSRDVSTAETDSGSAENKGIKDRVRQD